MNIPLRILFCFHIYFIVDYSWKTLIWLDKDKPYKAWYYMTFGYLWSWILMKAVSQGTWLK